MGVNLRDLFEREPIKIEDLAGKRIAVDALNMMFQFLSSIRARDGSLLRDSKGRVTPPLIGFFSRATHLLLAGVDVFFVFDGKAPLLKKKEQERRHELKQEEQKQYEAAVAEQNTADMRNMVAGWRLVRRI